MRAHYEKILPQETSSFHSFAYEKEEFDAPWHYHPEYELTYIVSSHGVRYTGNSFENFEANDLVLLGPNLPHCWKNTSLQPDKASAIVVHWDERLLGAGWLNQHEFLAIGKLLQRSVQGLRFETDVAVNLKKKLLSLVEFPPFQKLMAFLEILNELARCADVKVLCDRTVHGELNREDQKRLNHVFQYVKKNYGTKIKLAHLASETYMTEESFSRFFSKLMNKPFFSFLNEYRINVACKMLIESDVTIAQIVYACGFESLPFFYRQFKRYKDTSPKQFRDAYRRINFS
jgi:AraC-like DNA-binding protein